MASTNQYVALKIWFFMCLIINSLNVEAQLTHYQHQYQQHPPLNADPGSPDKCSRKLEDTLDSMLRRNRLKFGNDRTRIDVTPYSRYHSLYGNWDDYGSTLDQKLDLDNRDGVPSEDRPTTSDSQENNQHDRRPVNKIEVAEMRVRLPSNGKHPWVLVDKCQFNARNRTLDTRLVFPDLSISGRVILHPSGGYCNMILRLRRAGIEFRTTPLTFGHQFGDSTGRARPASVRTDSHFSEPGFLSVFAHGCQGPSGIKFRKNSKLNRFDHNYPFDSNRNEYASYENSPIKRSGSHFYNHGGSGEELPELYDQNEEDFNPYRKYKKNLKDPDQMNFQDEFFSADNIAGQSGRTFSELFSSDSGKYDPPYPHRKPQYHQSNSNWYNAELSPSNEVNEALTLELEQLFSIGVRGLLTTYMQKALQPAIKETLMENMGYVLSYG